VVVTGKLAQVFSTNVLEYTHSGGEFLFHPPSVRLLFSHLAILLFVLVVKLLFF
jgi:hypothetical protein